MTRDLRALADYLQALGVTPVAMEATGVLWKPVWNVLEGRFTLLLVNPRHLKKVPGRKTDVSDAEWIAQLLQCGLWRGSFVPPRSLRNLRDLTRHRAQLAGEHTRVANRIHKLLEDATSSWERWPPMCWASQDGRCCGPCSTAKRIRQSLRTWRWGCCGKRFRN
jgi:transposase